MSGLEQKTPQKKSIYVTLAIVVIFTVATILGLHANYSYLSLKDETINEMNKNSKKSLLSLEKNIKGYVESYAINEYEKLIRTELELRNFFAIVVKDYYMGRILGKDKYVSGSILNSEGGVVDYDPADESHQQQLKNCFHSDEIDVTKSSGELLGHITICTSDAFLNKELDKIIRKTMIDALFISVLLIISLFVFLRIFLLKPISDIVEVIEYSDKDGIPHDNVPLHGPREILVLADAMNRMMCSIRNSRKQLDVINRNLEERVKQRTHELEFAKDAANQANKAKSVFLANMSHELRTPMHAIISFTNLALKRAQDEKIEHFLSNIKTSSIRLTRLLNNLLDLSKLESGKMQADFATKDLAKVIDQAIAEVKSLVDESNIAINFNAEQPVECEIDEKLIIQVMVNLLSNAIKYSYEHTVIKIEIENVALPGSEEPAIQVAIFDQGVGIPEDQLESVFDHFVQSSETRSMAGGTGLGLPISKEIIEMHHGKIWAESPVKSQLIGSAFYFVIPVKQSIS